MDSHSKLTNIIMFRVSGPNCVNSVQQRQAIASATPDNATVAQFLTDSRKHNEYNKLNLFKFSLKMIQFKYAATTVSI